LLMLHNTSKNNQAFLYISFEEDCHE